MTWRRTCADLAQNFGRGVVGAAAQGLAKRGGRREGCHSKIGNLDGVVDEQEVLELQVAVADSQLVAEVQIC